MYFFRIILWFKIEFKMVHIILEYRLYEYRINEGLFKDGINIC